MFSSEIIDWLRSNSTTGSREYVQSHRADTIARLKELKIGPDSELAYFYSNFDAGSVLGNYSLLEIEDIQDATEYAHAELGVPDEYIALTGTEGEGIVLYNRRTQVVFDTPLDKINSLHTRATVLSPYTFHQFLQSCKATAGRK